MKKTTPRVAGIIIKPNIKLAALNILFCNVPKKFKGIMTSVAITNKKADDIRKTCVCFRISEIRTVKQNTSKDKKNTSG
ncbi:hypothetical protein [Leuconostoc citreum]|uniref:hypothetical protein n=1 Tax=Leuconostoc citreum TaxID=33964 RepID=UPI0032DE7615